MAMTSGSIVERLDVFGHFSARELSALVDPLLDAVFLQAREEGLSDRVVPAVATAAHVRLEATRTAEAPLVVTSILASLVGV